MARTKPKNSLDNPPEDLDGDDGTDNGRIDETPSAPEDEFSLDAPDDDDDDDGDDDDGPRRQQQQPDPSRPKPTRKDKKRNRYSELQSQLEAERSERQRIEREQAEMRGRMDEISRRGAGSEPAARPAPEDKRIGEIERQIELIERDYARIEKPTQADWEKSHKEVAALLDERDELKLNKRLRGMRPEQDPEAQQSAAQQQQMNQAVVARHNDMFTADRVHARKWALQRFNQLVLEGHDPKSMATVDQAYAEARKVFGYPARADHTPPPPAPRALKQALTGMPRSGGAGGAEPAGGTYKLTAADKAMARTMYPKAATDAERWKLYFDNEVRPMLDERKKKQSA